MKKSLLASHIDTKMFLNDTVLCCPICDSKFLHHSGITSFDRSEDDPVLRKTDSSGGVTQVSILASETSGNPSGRRDALVIRFWCETCTLDYNPDIELIISQHKGNTFLSWRYDVKSE